MHKKHLTLILSVISAFLILFLGYTLIAQAAATLYVDAEATGAADGSTWVDAYPDLQSALAAATDGDQIWVAAGVYYPDVGVGQTDNAIASTFILADGVALYGGFDPGSGVDELAERDWETYVTVLSGDIDGNDTTDPNGVVTATTHIVGSNTYHVVSSNNVTDTAMIDGFFITAGAASGSGTDSYGGGMYNYGGSPTLTNVTFSGNSASFFGGGMYNWDGDPTLTNVTFSSNSASSHGGGMFNWYGSPTLTNVAFSGNSASRYGGGMDNHNGSPTLTNVIFSGNSTTDGGGLFDWEGSPTLTNVTFSGNSASSSGGGMYNYFNSPTLTNVILWGNTASNNGPQIYNNNSAPLISYSDIQGSGGSGVNWDTALGTDGGGNIDADPLFRNSSNLRLQSASPSIDAGDNSAVPADTQDLDGDGDTAEPLPYDLDEKPRFMDTPLADSGSGSAPIVDMGAYELGYALEINKAVDDDTPLPGQTITFTIVVTNSELDSNGGLLSDSLPAGLNFLGSITLQPAIAGSVGTVPPTLASNLTIASSEKVTVTFPVTVSLGLTAGVELINTVAISSSEVITPVLASVTLIVQNAPPSAEDDSSTGFITDEDTAFTTANVLTNDTDLNGDTLSVSSIGTSSTQGTVTDNGDGTFAYDPNGQFESLAVGEQATDTFTYTVSDGHSGSAIATVTITITGVDDGFNIFLPIIIKGG